MNDLNYQILEVTGTSEEGIEQAIINALHAGEKLHGKMAWYEVTSAKKHPLENQRITFRAHVRIGCNTH